MIKTFKHKGLERFFAKGDHRGIPAKSESRIERLPDRLDASISSKDIDIPGFKFHPLKGDRIGEYSVSVTGNWRMIFSFVGQEAVHASLEDHH